MLKVEPNLCSETCETSCDGNEDIIVQVESTGEQHEEEEDPLLISFPAIKSEHKVSCTYVISHVCWPCYGAIQCQVSDGLTSSTALWTPTLSKTVFPACLVKNIVVPGDIIWILVWDIPLLPEILGP